MLEEEIRELIKNNDHAKVSELEDHLYKQHRCIALIYLEKFEEALKFADEDSFENFYCIYKLKKYKKCVSKLNSKFSNGDLEITENIPFLVLKAQCLYYLGYYMASFRILSRFKNESTIGTNLNALRSLILAAYNSHSYQKFRPRCKEIINESDISFINDYFKDFVVAEEEREEFEYNGSFSFLFDEKKFIEKLETNQNNKLMKNQLNNVIGNFEDLDYESLTKRQREIVEFNKTNSSKSSYITGFPKTEKSHKYLMMLKKGESNMEKDKVDKYFSNLPLEVKIFTAIKQGNFKKAKTLFKNKDKTTLKYEKFFKFLLDTDPSQSEIALILSNLTPIQ